MTTPAQADLDYRPSYSAAAIAAALIFLLYLITLSPSTAMWDTSEYIAAAFTFGLPHPPGNPLFVLLGRVFSILPIAPNVAMRINILAALCSAISAGMWFLITERVLVSWLPKRWQRIAGGALAAFIGATAFTVWAQSVVNEKVYTESLLGMALTAWLTVRWCDDPEGPKADRLLIIIAYLSGLGYANHMAGFLAVPAVAVAVLIRRWRSIFGLMETSIGSTIAYTIMTLLGSIFIALAFGVKGIAGLAVVFAIGGVVWSKTLTLRRFPLIVALTGALGFGLTPFLTQPVRAAHFPRINEGEVTGCAMKLAANCTFTQQTYHRFMYNFDRGQYGKPELTDRQASFPAQVGMWWLYFKWQWLRDPDGQYAGAQAALAWIFLMLGGLGGYVHWKRDRRSFAFFGPLIASVTLLLIIYMNFKYGYSQSPELGDSVAREVRDRDYFYLWSFSAWSVWVALGLIYVWEKVAEMIGSDPVTRGMETINEPRRASWIAASPLMAIAIVPIFANWSAASRHGQTDTRDFAHDLLDSVEPYGVLITVGDNDTFPLWYAQEVEGIRRDVTVLCTSLLNTDWYTRQMIRNPARPYDVAAGPAAYKIQSWPMPTKPLVNMTLAQSDAIQEAYPVTAPQEFKGGGGLNATVMGRDLGGGYRGLDRADMFVYFIIRDAFPGRSVFFSRTDGNYPEELGFNNHVVISGLARKLVADVPTPSAAIVNLPGEGWFDLNTTYSLWTQTFDGMRSLSAKQRWLDKPSVGIPYMYVRTGLDLAQALQSAGRTADAQKVMTQVRGVAKGAQLEQALGGQL